jgi:Ca2+-binding RTX toxin-like protein
VQPDADHLGQYTLVVQGTEGIDGIFISQAIGGMRVQIKGLGVNFDHSFTQPISRIEIYGQGGNDQITVAPDVTTPAYIFAGNGNNVITGGGGQTVIVGGSGHNLLTGGSGPTILIAGSGQDVLKTGSGAALVVAGTTKFDANAEALRVVLAEWSRTDETFDQKVAHLTGEATGGKNVIPNTTQSIVLNATTVQSHPSIDIILRQNDTGVQDLIFARLLGPAPDLIHDDAATIFNLPSPM